MLVLCATDPVTGGIDSGVHGQPRDPHDATSRDALHGGRHRPRGGRARARHGDRREFAGGLDPGGTGWLAIAPFLAAAFAPWRYVVGIGGLATVITGGTGRCARPTASTAWPGSG